MFYISRKDRSGAWITDTLDGVSEYYYYFDIIKIVEKGIGVEGVDGDVFRVVSPYDNADVAKNVLLRGIEYHVGEHGELCYLSTVENFIGEPVRLSEFCTSVLDFAFWDNKEFQDFLVIFDDRIHSIGELAFASLCDSRVMCDVSEVTREDLRMQIYKAYVLQLNNLNVLYSLITDTYVKTFYFLEASILYAKTDLPPFCFSEAGMYAETRFLSRNKSKLVSIICKAERFGAKKRIVLDASDYDFLTHITSPSDLFGVAALRGRVFWRSFGLRVLRNYFNAGGRDKDLVEMTFRAVIELTNKCTEVRA